MRAVVLHTDDHWLVMVGDTCRGEFSAKSDAQLWALTVAAIEPDISHAVMACGTCIEK